MERAERAIPETAMSVFARASFERAKKSIREAQDAERQRPTPPRASSLDPPQYFVKDKRVPGTSEQVDIFDDIPGSLEHEA